MKRIVLLLVMPLVVGAQTTINGGRIIKGTLDASGAASTLPYRTGSGSPAGRDSCGKPGETYFQTDAQAGQNVWGCTASGTPGTWNQLSAGATVATGTTAPGGSCSAGALYVRTDMRQFYICSAANVWQLGSYGSDVLANRPVSCAAGQIFLATDAGTMSFCAAPGNPGTWQAVGGALASVFGRTGAVTAHAGDYTAAQVGALNDPGSNGIVKRTAANSTAVAVAGDFPTLNQSTTGNAATATALAGAPTQCTGGQFATGVSASGNANCSTPAGGGNASLTATTVSFSATPTFARSTNIQEFILTLSGNVTSSTLNGAVANDILIFQICQDATGGRTFAWPNGFTAGVTVSPTANACTKQQFVWDGATANPTAPATSTDTPFLISGAPERAAPATPANGIASLWPDSTRHTWASTENNSGNLHIMPRTAGGGDQLASTDLSDAVNINLLNTGQTVTGDKTHTGKVDNSGSTHTLPSKTGLAANKPATCTTGEEYFATDAAAGQNKYFCTAANTWTQHTGGVTSVFGQTGAVANLSGDVTTSGSSAATLATVNAGPGSCGDATHVCQVTTNGKGLVTSQSAVATNAPQLNAANTYSGGGSQDFSAMNIKVPAASGFTATSSNNLGYDTTSLNLHIWDGADALVAPFASAPTSGHCVSATVSSGKVTLADAGGACGAGGGGTVSSGTASHLPYYGSTGTVISDAGADLVFNGTHTWSAASTAILDFSAIAGAAGYKVPVQASAAPTADGAMAVDSSSHRLKVGNNGSTSQPVYAGVDINTSDQVTATHLAAPLPRAQGGLNSTSAGTGLLRDGTTPTASELSGDITTSGSNATTLATVNSAPGACGDATHVCIPTTNGKGLVTSQTTAAITFPVNTVFGRSGAVVATSGDYTAAQVTNAAQTNASNTFTAGTQDFSGAAHTLPALKGTAASKPATCTQGEQYFATDATAGQNLYFCTATNTWTQQLNSGGSGSSSVFTGSTATAPSFSSTPTFSLADVSVKSATRVEVGTMSANVTSVTFTNKTAGAKFSIVWTQAASGGPYTVTYGASVSSSSNPCQVSATASATTEQFFEVGSDGSTVYAINCVSNDTPFLISGAPERAAPPTPASALAELHPDSTRHTWAGKANGSTNDHIMPRTSGSTDQLASTDLSDTANVNLLNANQTESGNKTFTGAVDASGATHTLPAKVGTAASKPATCTIGEMYFATDATAGQNWYYCTATNTWTQQLNSGSGGGGGATISGTATLGTSAISANSCASAATVSATGMTTSNAVTWTPTADISGVTGYGNQSTDGLKIYGYPTSGNVNFKVCNGSAASITPGAVTLNWFALTSTTVYSGTQALGTSAISANTCATALTVTATGIATTDAIEFSPNGDWSGVTGWGDQATDGLKLYVWPTPNTINLKVCNGSAASITPGAATVNLRVAR